MEMSKFVTGKRMQRSVTISNRYYYLERCIIELIVEKNKRKKEITYVNRKI